MSPVADRVKKIVSEHMDVDEDQVSENTSFVTDLGADSLDQVELVMKFEDAFDIRIPDDVGEKIQTVGDAIGYIQEQQ